MEVLFISYKYPPSIGGMQKQSFELIEGYEKISKAHKIIYRQSGSLVLFFISLLWKIPIVLFKNKNIRILHFNDGVCAAICLWTKLLKGYKLSVTYHGLDLVFPNWFYQKCILKMLHSYDLIIAVSTATKKACLARGFAAHKIRVILNGVDKNLNIFPSEVDKNKKELIHTFEKKKVLISIGRPVKRKGFPWFVKNILSKLDEDFLFILIGPHPNYNPILERIINTLPNKIRTQINLFFGRSTEHHLLKQLTLEYPSKFIWAQDWDHNSKLFALYKSDLFVMPNQKVAGDMEGFGLVALEANICKTYVCASRLEGITSAIEEGVNGTLLEYNNPNAWINTINTYCNSIKILKEKGIKARNHVSTTFTWEQMVQHYAQAFQSILTDQKTLISEYNL